MKEERFNLIKEKLKNFKVEYDDVNGTPRCIVDKKDIIEVAGILKKDEELKFDFLHDIVSVDRFQKQNRFEIIANLFSNKFRDRIFLRIKLDSKNPVMPSLTAVWKSADWYEREAYDMMGINFEGHPDLRRVYLPEEFEYFPLRKDFPLMGIPGSLSLPKK
jgi:NADH-quinone oxidoreductase subunit C